MFSKDGRLSIKILSIVLLMALGIAGCANLASKTPVYATEAATTAKKALDKTKDCPKGTPGQKDEIKRDIYTIAECSVKDDDSFMSTLTTIINVIVGVLGVVAVGVIVLGGVTFVTSQGDAAKVTKAKNTIIYGIVGLLVAILAFAIVNFVLGAVF